MAATAQVIVAAPADVAHLLDKARRRAVPGAVMVLDDCQCFAVRVGDAIAAAYAVAVREETAWVVYAAAERAAGWLAGLFDLVESQARGAGLSEVAFLTRRRGLVRAAKSRGYACEVREWGYRLAKTIRT